jgi:hypothetical protein
MDGTHCWLVISHSLWGSAAAVADGPHSSKRGQIRSRQENGRIDVIPGIKATVARLQWVAGCVD